ncbi:hypothetical protein [Falsiroseomonas oryzae]|uniref:hypothetical protein n=1 Tax=Falsiroseomonas oryzae TaxID=2766473 RepID=UPI0022EAD07B|nr:hypothetical protein [Roseomonas sp. MO-31]
MGESPESKPHNAPRPAPPNWGRDALTQWLDQVRGNQWATFARLPDTWARFSAIDGLFERMITDWRDPPDILAAHLFLRCYSAYRTAVAHASAGMAVETHLMCRALLECAGYAIHIMGDPERGVTLLNRSEPDGEQRARDEFAAGRVRRSVATANAGMGERYKTLYGEAINFGAHPNEGAITGSMDITDGENGDRLMKQIMLHEPGPMFDFGLRRVMQSAVVALEIFSHVFPDRFALLGVDADLIHQQSGL